MQIDINPFNKINGAFLFMPLPAITHWRHSVYRLSIRVCVCPWSYPKSLWTWYLTNHLCEFHQIYKVSALGDKDEPIRFDVKRLMIKAW